MSKKSIFSFKQLSQEKHPVALSLSRESIFPKEKPFIYKPKILVRGNTFKLLVPQD